MKKIILAVVIVTGLVYFISCTKADTGGFTSCSGPSAASDSTVLLAFAAKDSITPTLDTSGMYYQIITQGAGIRPTGTAQITVTYVAKYLNGDVFDSSTAPVVLPLATLILGWQYGLPKIQPGGRIKLLLPSALAYGCQGTSSIPPNTPVYFDISLISVSQ